MIHFAFLTEVVNVKTAIMYRELEKETHMEYPHGMKNAKKDDFISLKKSIHVIVQAGKQKTTRL